MYTASDLLPQGPALSIDHLETAWQAPSNIALVKYWGKKEGQGPQIPANPSVSFTLSACQSQTRMQLRPRKAGEPLFQFMFEGQHQPSFEPKIADFFARILPLCPYVDAYHWTIDSSNTFPHSSGIASSASAMAALAACIVDLEQQLFAGMSPEIAQLKASWLARLGSGSACRSLQGPAVMWGQHAELGSNDYYGTPISFDLHPNFKDCRDSILLIETGQKQVSSTAGHGLMKNHPYASARFEQAHRNLSNLLVQLQQGDWEGFIQLVESEALTLHAMMMCSQPYYMLMRPNTLAALEAITQFRRDTGLPLCFTLDAGANVHLLYAASADAAVKSFIADTLSAYCHEGQVLHDQLGQGAAKLYK